MPKNGDLCPILGQKTEKWRISAGLRVFLWLVGRFLGTFLVVGWVIFMVVVDFAVLLG